ncbi:DNA cytosine methyltransferase [Streptomyces sp. S186]|uniref:DNA cytosine methyltransferase n=1 Tax=Streptomyces sp. S186 TaxID=3434395 RepID=UPI003F6715A2
MSGPRIGSLFTGTGALDLAVMDVFGGEVVWHSQYEPPDKDGREDTNQYAAKILARHWPTVPNLGDVTAIDWAEVEPVDILTGGFPCTDVSTAGRRAGLTPDTRSGLWTHMARAIHVLRPQLVVIENVQGLLSAKAAGDMEPCPQCVGDGSVEPPLRACGAVLGDLARLGFDAEWCVVAASEVGAPHPRKRVFVIAWPAAADADGGQPERRGVAGVLGSQAATESREGDQRERAGHAAGHRGEAAADAPHFGHERGRSARDGRAGSANGDLAAVHADSTGLEVRRVEPDGPERQAAERGDREPAADADGGGLQGHGELSAGRDALRRRIRDDADRRDPAPADAASVGRGEGRAESAGLEGRPDAAERRVPDLELRAGDCDIDWGPYSPAIWRWERILGRRAPWPTDVRGRLSPVFTEWMMGLPEGWVTETPGLTRSAMLKALGNGVVRHQAVAGIQLLHERAGLPAPRLALEAAA